MRSIIKRQRRTHHTILIVGEGHADYRVKQMDGVNWEQSHPGSGSL